MASQYLLQMNRSLFTKKKAKVWSLVKVLFYCLAFATLVLRQFKTVRTTEGYMKGAALERRELQSVPSLLSSTKSSDGNNVTVSVVASAVTPAINHVTSTTNSSSFPGTKNVNTDNRSIPVLTTATTISTNVVTTVDSSSSSLPINLHQNFSIHLDDIASLTTDQVSKQVDPSTLGQFEMVYGYNKKTRNVVGHRAYRGPMMNGVTLLTKLQSYSYAALNRFWQLVQEHNSSNNNNLRFSAYGGTIMGSACHGSMNPWDDDIDITVNDCSLLEAIYDKLPLAAEVFPELRFNQHTAKKEGWIGRAIDKEWILIKGPRSHPWYKLKSVTQMNDIPHRDLSGMDIFCFGNAISRTGIFRPDRKLVARSGYQAYLTGNKTMDVVPFGPTTIMQVPDAVLRKYVLERYGKTNFCDFPLGKKLLFPQTLLPPSLPYRAFQMHEALSKYYISPSVRSAWLDQVGNGKGNQLTKNEIPNLNHVEVDNSIAPPESCKMGENLTTIKVVDWNAGRGTYWAEFAEMIEAIPDLEQPDVVILNGMDIGMARSGNIHTARKLAFRLGMNYAWGLEFVELTNGNEMEQNATMGMKNAMGLHGNAILSSCPIFDPILVRDELDEKYFSSEKFEENAMGHEKRLGGRMGMFVRTGGALLEHAMEQKYIVVGSVHKVKPNTQRETLWDYFGFGPFPDITKDAAPKPGTAPSNVLGIVMAGDLESREFCLHAGIQNLDEPMKHPTFPVDCPTKQLGAWRGDQFCGNMKVHTEDKNFLPCYNQTAPGDATSSNSTSLLQLSDHAIIQIVLETK